jgi:hypothetical protein
MLPDAERFRLRYGPYAPPKCRIGGWLTCRLRSRVRVVAISDARIQWPMTRHVNGGNATLILCGDLVKAVRRESTTARADRGVRRRFIPQNGPPRSPRPSGAARSAFTEAEDALLGTMTDLQVALRIGRSPIVVAPAAVSMGNRELSPTDGGLVASDGTKGRTDSCPINGD